MSRLGLSFLALTIACAVLTLLGPEQAAWSGFVKFGLGLFGVLSFIAMVMGRRIKFDPVLR